MIASNIETTHYWHTKKTETFYLVKISLLKSKVGQRQRSRKDKEKPSSRISEVIQQEHGE